MPYPFASEGDGLLSNGDKETPIFVGMTQFQSIVITRERSDRGDPGDKKAVGAIAPTHIFTGLPRFARNDKNIIPQKNGCVCDRFFVPD